MSPESSEGSGVIAGIEKLKSTPPPKLSFDNGGEFIRQTRREVEEYLSTRRTRVRGRVELYAKGIVAFGLLLASWLTLVLGDPGLWLGLLSLGGLIAGTPLTAFCVMHDANHGAYFRARRLNHLMGWTADALLGLSSYAWRVKHNVAHHTYTNVDGYDADITQVPFARLMPVQAPRPWYRLQHYYIWALYCVMALRWQTVGDVAAFVRGRIGTSALRLPRRWDLAGLIGGKVIFVGWAIVVPMFVYPWWAVLGVYLAYSMVVSLIVAVTFQLAHCVEEADFASAEQLAIEPRLWAVHEVETTVDFCPRNPIISWMVGGLNYQIEHHLFPRVPHTHYAQIAKIVQRNAELHGVRYVAQRSLWGALRSHFRHLRTMGRLGVPIAVEMG
ncbi:MAG: acyl-CoA desaturase [Actinobacteria bacterium]|nr:MAG: acyl-CoA desaturase [Actinomycetota bacterium]